MRGAVDRIGGAHRRDHAQFLVRGELVDRYRVLAPEHAQVHGFAQPPPQRLDEGRAAATTSVCAEAASRTSAWPSRTPAGVVAASCCASSAATMRCTVVRGRSVFFAIWPRLWPLLSSASARSTAAAREIT